MSRRNGAKQIPRSYARFFSTVTMRHGEKLNNSPLQFENAGGKGRRFGFFFFLGVMIDTIFFVFSIVFVVFGGCFGVSL